jgi:Protein of unknown function (DUF3237)
VSVELIPLCTFVAELAGPLTVGPTPAGERTIFEVESGAAHGPRLCGRLEGRSAADWLTVGPEGTGTIDVRALLKTDDGARVFIQYQGRVDATVARAPIYIAPRFETGDLRYSWLNRVQAVGKGELVGRTLTYEVYEVR